MVRKLFHFGARSKKISSQNEKNPAPLYSIKSNRNRSVLGSYSGDSSSQASGEYH
nr:hypothetical protein [Porphyromonas gingivalis]